MVDDRGVALADARGLDDDQIEAGRLADRDRVGERGAQAAGRAARGERAHKDALGADRVHPDPVPEQRPPRAPARRVDREHGEARLGVGEQVAAQQLVGQARLARAAGARDPEHGRRARRARQRELAGAPGLGHRDRARDVPR